MERQAGLNTQESDRGRRKAVRVEAKGWRAILKIDKAIWVFLVFSNDMCNNNSKYWDIPLHIFLELISWHGKIFTSTGCIVLGPKVTCSIMVYPIQRPLGV